MIARSTGFTGASEGMTRLQMSAVAQIWRQLRGNTLHHGDCVGADQEMHTFVRSYSPRARIIGHPPTNPAKRAWCVCYELREEKEYLARNRDIVQECTDLIAAPKEFTEQRRGGTWYTIRRAREAGKHIIIILPDGTFHEELSTSGPQKRAGFFT